MKPWLFLAALALVSPLRAGEQEEIDGDLVALAQKGDLQCVSLYLKNGANPSAKDGNKTSVLMWAVRHRDLQAARELTAAGADVNAVDKSSITVLMHAAGARRDFNRRLILRFLGPRIKNADAKDGEGRTALMRSVMRGDREAVEDILGLSGLDVDAVDGRGMTALMHAIDGKDPEIIQAVLARAQKLDIQDQEGNSALMVAAFAKDRALVSQLLERGAEAGLENKSGLSFLSWAETRELEELDRRGLLVQRSVLGWREAAREYLRANSNDDADRARVFARAGSGSLRDYKKALDYGTETTQAMETAVAIMTGEADREAYFYLVSHNRIPHWEALGFARVKALAKSPGPDHRVYDAARIFGLTPEAALELTREKAGATEGSEFSMADFEWLVAKIQERKTPPSARESLEAAIELTPCLRRQEIVTADLRELLVSQRPLAEVLVWAREVVKRVRAARRRRVS